MDLANLSEEMLSYFDLPIEEIYENSQKWDIVIKSHLLKMFNSLEGPKLPNFEKGMEWLNTLRPLSLEDLKNKIIIMDFFTYCCINCEHVLPLLKEVQEEFKDNSSVAMIGVHSPKFPNEKVLQNIQSAILRNNITYPVLHDHDSKLWINLGIYCWPTVLIISPAHTVLFALVGEDQIKKLNHLAHQTLKFFEASENVVLNIDPLPMTFLTENASQILRFPSNITYFNGNIILSDTGHNRLILISSEGNILDIIGNGVRGYVDGTYSQASFNNPHGTAGWKHKIFVADTGNHSIRQIDLMTKTVSTIFDSSQVSEWPHNDLNLSSEKVFKEKFSSPWDLCIGPKLGSDLQSLDVLYIAVAGSHQIWALYLTDSILSDKQSGTCIPFAGNGKEECRNNFYRMKAGFAQPSGITYSDLGVLFIADSESSTIRSISLQTGIVKTVVGGGLNPEDLFQYGDADGTGMNVKLQHPLALCAIDNGKICVADTYNNKLKLVDSKSRECQTISAKHDDTEAAIFNEPSGLCYLCNDNILLASDTNNHCIKKINLETKVLNKINLNYTNSCVDGPDPSISPADNEISLENVSIKLSPFKYQNLRPVPVKVNLNSEGEIHIHFYIATEGLSLTENSLQPWNITYKGDCDWKMTCSGNLFHPDIQPSLVLKCIKASEISKSEIEFEIDVTACDNIKKTCLSTGGKILFQITTSKKGCEVFILKLIL